MNIKKYIIIIIFLFFPLVIFAENSYYLDSPSLGIAGSITGQSSNPYNVFYNPGMLYLRRYNLVFSVAGMSVFQQLDNFLSLKTINGAFLIKIKKMANLAFGYGGLFTPYYNEQKIGFGLNKSVVGNLFFGMSVFADLQKFSSPDGSFDPVLSDSFSKTKFHYSFGTGYKYSSTLSIGVYGRDIALTDDMWGIGVSHIFYRNPKSLLNKISFSADSRIIKYVYPQFRAGAQFNFLQDLLVLYVGICRNYLSSGASVQYKQIEISGTYLYYLNNIGLGGSTKLSLNYKL